MNFLFFLYVNLMLILCISIDRTNIQKINIQKLILFIQFIQFDFVHFGFYCPPKNGIHLSFVYSIPILCLA